MRRSIHVVLCLSIAFVLASLSPARIGGATSPGAGTIAFSLVASLPTYPCAPPGCDGVFGGTSSGHLAGRDGTIPWNVSWLPGAPGTAAGTFHYADDCDFPVGVAYGSGTLTEQLPLFTGSYGPVPGAALPYPVVKVDSAFTFVWTRIGVTAVVTSTIWIAITVAEPSGYRAITVVSAHKSVALAAFAPTSGTPPTCTTPGPLTAAVAAIDAVAA